MPTTMPPSRTLRVNKTTVRRLVSGDHHVIMQGTQDSGPDECCISEGYTGCDSCFGGCDSQPETGCSPCYSTPYNCDTAQTCGGQCGPACSIAR